ncbi:MAG: hypothetical protein HY744_10230 [Deltaproteobacteria bacterium]|nr:hypothetical protein [Deltaproteobacteria bacterium]
MQLEQVLQLAREPAPAAHGRARAAEAAAPRLVVEETPDESLPVGTLFELGRQNVAICWADPSGIAIDDPRLKAQEFVLVWRGQQHMLVPRFLPVEVNGTLVRDAVALDGTALIRAGATALVYRLGDPPWQAPLRLRPGDRDRAHLVMERCTASRRALLAEPRLVIEHGSCQGRSFALPYSAVTIGVHPEADLCLDDPEAALVAAVVTVEQGRVWISQVGTSPQPRINGQSRERQRLRSGDRIALGATVLRYELARLPATAELDAAAKPAPTQEGSANAAPLQDALPAGQQVAVSVGSRWQKVAAWARSNRRLVLPLVLLASIALLLAWLWRSGCGPGAVRRAGSPSPALGSLER